MTKREMLTELRAQVANDLTESIRDEIRNAEDEGYVPGRLHDACLAYVRTLTRAQLREIVGEGAPVAEVP